MPGAAFSFSPEADTHGGEEKKKKKKPVTPAAQALTEGASGLEPCWFFIYFFNHRLNL